MYLPSRSKARAAVWCIDEVGLDELPQRDHLLLGPPVLDGTKPRVGQRDEMAVLDVRSLAQRGKALGDPDRVSLSARFHIGPMQRVRELVRERSADLPCDEPMIGGVIIAASNTKLELLK